MALFDTEAVRNPLGAVHQWRHWDTQDVICPLLIIMELSALRPSSEGSQSMITTHLRSVSRCS